MSTRRSFLKSTTLLCTAASISSSLLAQKNRDESALFSLQNLFLYSHHLMSEASFRKLVGSSFDVLLHGSRSSMQLIAVRSAKEDETDAMSTFSGKQTQAEQQRMKAASLKRQLATTKEFRLEFVVEDTAFPQGTYQLEHGVIGSTVMFLVPGDAKNTVKKSCSAIFNMV